LSSNGYIVDDDGYWYVTGEGEQYLQQSMKQGVAEGNDLPGDFKLMGQNLFLKNLARNLKQRYPAATVKLSSDRVTAYHNKGDDERLTVMGTEVMDSGYIGVGLDDAFTESFQGVLVPTIKQTTEQLLAANPGTRPALFLSTDNWNPDAWTHIADKLGYRLVADDEELDEGTDNKENPNDQVRNKLNDWMEEDQQFTDPTQRAPFQAKVWPYIQTNINSILSDKGKDGKGGYPAAPYAAWLLVQHMDAYPQNQVKFLQQLTQSGLNPDGKLQFLKDRAAVNQWIAANANKPEYFIKGKPLPNPTVNVRNPAMFKDAGIVATSREEALQNAQAAGNKLLVAAVQATNAQTQPSYKQGVAEGFENFNGIDIDMDIEGDEIMVRAMANGRELGHVLFVEDGEYLMPQDLEVEEKYRGQGIAQIMYDYVKSKGYKIRRSGQQTDAGAGFWDKHRPEQNVWENFADGRNPGRKGLAKRSGVNTKASVSSLRNTAKHSSGEKQRMAHWLANMKAGRAKAKRK
jgi:GNAT superfamily N-acetyltransferase